MQTPCAFGPIRRVRAQEKGYRSPELVPAERQTIAQAAKNTRIISVTFLCVERVENWGQIDRERQSVGEAESRGHFTDAPIPSRKNRFPAEKNGLFARQD